MDNRTLAFLLIPAFIALYEGGVKKAEILCVIGIILLTVVSVGILVKKNKK